MKELEFIEIVKFYSGYIERSKAFNAIMFHNDNIITSYYENGMIFRQKKVKCSVWLNFNSNTLWAKEQTGMILGGCGGLEATEKQLLKLLKKYNFQKKDVQLELF